MMADPYQVCLMTVDGTDFLVQEPCPFDPGYYSHKLEHAGLRYEIGICIKTGWIVWVNGPFPCGDWPDLRIARSSLHHELCADEVCAADTGYMDQHGFSFNPNKGEIDFEERTHALARARHETVNNLFKKYNSLRTMWRHPREKHGIVVHAITKIVQLGLLSQGKGTFSIEYDEAEFEDCWVV